MKYSEPMGENQLNPLVRLKYRRTVKSLFWLLVLALVISELVIIRLNLSEAMRGDWISASITILLASSVQFSFLYRLVFIVHPRIFSTIDLFSDRMIVKTPWWGQSEILFSNIESLSISWFSPRFFGGFNVYLKTGQRFMFLSLLQDNHKILQRILRERPELMSEEVAQRYVFMSDLVDTSWSRIKRKFRNVPAVTGKYLILPAAFTAITMGLGYKWEGIPVSENILRVFTTEMIVLLSLAFLTNHIEERIISYRRLKKVNNGQSKDLHWIFERRVEYICQFLFGILFVGIHLFFWI